ncbi:MAG: hypothetical protein OYL92_15825 [Acidobacteriota bacterium]|nr:hypothetical protein [Acidobacteriota bacterium]MDE3266437.1 hypothetical protein [Acidobacteriota bacterium]
MSTTRLRTEPGDPATLPEGRIDATKVGGITEAEISLQPREDDGDALQAATRLTGYKANYGDATMEDVARAMKHRVPFKSSEKVREWVRTLHPLYALQDYEACVRTLDRVWSRTGESSIGCQSLQVRRSHAC